jgi:hypothetical protein
VNGLALVAQAEQPQSQPAGTELADVMTLRPRCPRQEYGRATRGR